MDACSYHARSLAPWMCPECDKYFCTECFPGGENNFGRPGPRCPLCRTRLEWLGIASAAPPFWRVTGQFFGYAAQPSALGVMALFALGTSVAGGGFLGLGIALLLLAILTRYAMTAIQRVAEGNNTAPGPADVIGGSGTSHSLQLLAVMVLFAIVIGLLRGVSPLLGVAAQVVQSGILPASIMVLAMTGSVFSAANPVLVFRVIGVIGWSYLVLWMAVMAVTSGPAFVAMLMPGRMTGFVAALIGAAVFYFTAVAAAMMGYVLYHRSGELGIADGQPKGEDLSTENFLRRSALGHANIYLQERRPDDARMALREALQKFPGDIALRDRLHQTLLRGKDDEALARHADEYCGLLVRTRNAGKAASVWLDVRQRVADFRPADAEVCESIATFLHDQGRGKDALPLLVNLHSRAPAYAGLARAYLLLARLYVETRNDTATALKVLGFVRAKFPRDPAAEDAARYEEVIARLPAQPAASKPPAAP